MSEKTQNSESANQDPFIFDNNWGNWGKLPQDANQLTTTNADGEPVVPLTEEQKFVFDTQGWLMIPDLLSEDDLKEMREFCYQLVNDKGALPPHQQTPIAGPLEKLVDHPVVVGFCNEFLAYPALSSEEYYGFRFETSFLLYRQKGMGKFGPHNGNGLWRLPGNSHIYRNVPGKGYSGLTRVVWELNPVKKFEGGTLFINGSHKAAYKIPESIRDINSSLWDSYECPAGSVLFFSEATTHSAQPWQNESVDRVPIFNQYNSIGSRFHWWEPPKELLDQMPPKRRSLFRQAYSEGANTDLEIHNLFQRPIG